MTESSKKSTRNASTNNHQTVAYRGIIGANWEKFLSSNLIMDKMKEQPIENDKKEHFSGTFRRMRKKLNQSEHTNSVQSNLETEQIQNVTLNGNMEKNDRIKSNNTKNKLTKFIAMDCEMVGIGYNGNDNMLARISLVNKFGDCVYDKFVKPREEVKDYRTSVSGVRKEDLLNDEQPIENNKKEHFSGTIRRMRKKLNQSEHTNSVQSNLETEQIQNVTLNGNMEKNDRIKSNNTKNKLTKFIAMDCEMVGIGYNGNDNMLARISLVNKFGDCVYDKFVKPREEVKNYRTSVSGVRKEDLLNGEEFSTVQKEIAEIIRGRILVGHSLMNDLRVLFLSHPKRCIRDTSRYAPFKKITKGSTPSLKRLAKEILNIDIQHGEHSSVEDARAAMQLYCTVAKNWEASMSSRRGYSKKIIEE